MPIFRKIQMHFNTIKNSLKKMKEKGSYDIASHTVKKSLDQLAKLKENNEFLKYQIDQCKKAIDNRNEKETRKYMKIIRNTIMFG